MRERVSSAAPCRVAGLPNSVWEGTTRLQGDARRRTIGPPPERTRSEEQRLVRRRCETWAHGGGERVVDFDRARFRHGAEGPRRDATSQARLQTRASVAVNRHGQVLNGASNNVESHRRDRVRGVVGGQDLVVASRNLMAAKLQQSRQSLDRRGTAHHAHLGHYVWKKRSGDDGPILDRRSMRVAGLRSRASRASRVRVGGCPRRCRRTISGGSMCGSCGGSVLSVRA